MSVAIVLSGVKDIPLIHWAARIARARQQMLALVWTIHRRGETKRTSSSEHREIPESLQETCEALDRDIFRLVRCDGLEGGPDDQEEGPQIPLCVISIATQQMEVELEKEVTQLGVTCLILPRDAGDRTNEVHDHLLANVECEIVMLTPGSRSDHACREIVTPVGGGPHSTSCLRMARDIAQTCQARLVAVHVEPEVDEVAPLAAERVLSKAVTRALGGTAESNLEKRVAMSRDVVAGITQCVSEESDLIILGMKRHGIVRRFSSQGIAERLVNAQPGPAVAVVQAALPISSRFVHWLDDVLRGNVPQLPREQRVKLVERIQQSSQWDFDFILLICLSTLIAAGGLIQNSAAVVIGAMLVAPLMTPLLGTGLSLVQGNGILFQSTLLTVFRGFVVAFVLSWGVAIVASPQITAEMLGRGSPRVLDIAVALVSGIAAAYASGRPNLLSALPGVAIAASLVPPIATSGIASWAGDLRLAVGSALLFFTNIVAIVLGTAIAFRAVGIHGTHRHGNISRWTVFASSALLLTILILGIVESRRGTGVAADVETRLQQMASQHGVVVESLIQQPLEGRPGLHLVLRGPQPLSKESLIAVRQQVFQEMHHIERVSIEMHLSAVFAK